MTHRCPRKRGEGVPPPAPFPASRIRTRTTRWCRRFPPTPSDTTSTRLARPRPRASELRLDAPTQRRRLTAHGSRPPARLERCPRVDALALGSHQILDSYHLTPRTRTHALHRRYRVPVFQRVRTRYRITRLVQPEARPHPTIRITADGDDAFVNQHRESRNLSSSISHRPLSSLTRLRAPPVAGHLRIILSHHTARFTISHTRCPSNDRPDETNPTARNHHRIICSCVHLVCPHSF